MTAVHAGRAGRAGRLGLEARAVAGTALLVAGFALVSLVCWYVLTPVVADAAGPVVLTVAVMVTAVVPRLLIGALVAHDAARRGVGRAGAVLSCLVGAALGAAVLPGSLSVLDVVTAPGTTMTWGTLLANVVFTALNVAAGAALPARWRRRRTARRGER